MKDVLCLYKAVEGSKFSPEIFHNFPLNFPQKCNIFTVRFLVLAAKTSFKYQCYPVRNLF